MKSRPQAFTLVELLVVIAIIALLVSILIPTFNRVRTIARRAKVKTNINTIGVGVETFSNDYGNYPSSSREEALDTATTLPNAFDNGGHRLVEALAGIDLLGHSDETQNNLPFYDLATGDPPTRKEPYIPIDGIELVNFRVVFERNELQPGPPTGAEAVAEEWDKLDVSAGNNNLRNNLNPILTATANPRKPRPILYYKAHKSMRFIGEIYNVNDNLDITEDRTGDEFHYPAFVASTGDYDQPPTGATQTFEEAIWNPETSAAVTHAQARPYNAKSFLLIAAGEDGLYGTEDDITNYGE